MNNGRSPNWPLIKRWARLTRGQMTSTFDQRSNDEHATSTFNQWSNDEHIWPVVKRLAHLNSIQAMSTFDHGPNDEYVDQWSKDEHILTSCQAVTSVIWPVIQPAWCGPAWPPVKRTAAGQTHGRRSNARPPVGAGGMPDQQAAAFFPIIYSYIILIHYTHILY